jgi:hypothetical protein
MSAFCACKCANICFEGSVPDSSHRRLAGHLGCAGAIRPIFAVHRRSLRFQDLSNFVSTVISESCIEIGCLGCHTNFVFAIDHANACCRVDVPGPGRRRKHRSCPIGAVNLTGDIPGALAEYREPTRSRRSSNTDLQREWNEDSAQDYSIMFGREAGIVVGSFVHHLSPVRTSPLLSCE